MVQSLVSTGIESTYSLYPFLSKLLCLLEIEEASSAHLPSPDHSQMLYDTSFLSKWENRRLHINSDFQFVEPVLALRASVLHNLLEVGRQDTEQHSKEKDDFIGELSRALVDVLFNISRAAREAETFQVCII